GGGGGGVVVVVGHGQLHGVGPGVAAIEAGLVQAHAGDAAGGGAAVVDLSRDDRRVAGGVECNGHVPGHGDRRGKSQRGGSRRDRTARIGNHDVVGADSGSGNGSNVLGNVGGTADRA